MGLGLGESSTFEPVRKADLIVKEHSTEEAKERPVSITLRFNEPEERDEWVGAFIIATEDIVEQNKMIHKEEEESDDKKNSLIDPTQAMANASRCCQENACIIS